MWRFVFITFLFSFLLNFNLKSQDLTVPDFQSVSINPEDGTIKVKWKNPNDPNITYFEISRQPFSGGLYSFNSIGSVKVPNSEFTDTNVTNINQERQTYRIRSANATKFSAITSMHITMMINGLYDACKNEIEVRWTPYKQNFIDANGKIVTPHEPEDTFNNAISYEIWGYEGVDPFDIKKAIKLGNKVSKTIDTIKNLNINSNYFLFVKAFLPNSDIATSYRISMTTNSRKPPQYMNIDSVITKNGSVNLFFNVDKNSQLDTFALYRTDIKSRPISWFRGEIPKQYVDGDVQLGLTYNYYLGVFRCGKLLKQSDTVNNILLNVNGSGQITTLKWSSFTNKISMYELMRVKPNQEIIYNITDSYVYEDNIKSLMENGAFNFCYQIKADNKNSIARSDVQCITMEPIIKMPDAIDPLSDIVNTKTGMSRNRFGPVLSFKDDRYRYTLEIFNKLGVRIFKAQKEFNDSISPFYYWDGRYNGDYVKEDVYIYTLKFEFKDRKPFIQNGTVTVVYKQ